MPPHRYLQKAPCCPPRWDPLLTPADGTASQSGGVKEMGRQMRSMRSQMEENEELSSLMASLRGSNLSDADFADASVQVGRRPAGQAACRAGGLPGGV